MGKKVLSFLLSIVMTFSILPYNVFAEVKKGEPGKGQNNTGSGGSSGNQLDATSDFSMNHLSNNGMRFSLYFVQGDWTSYSQYLNAEKDLRVDGTPMTNSYEEHGRDYIVPNTLEIGKLETVQDSNDVLSLTKYWSSQTVFDRMNKDGGMSDCSLFYDDFQDNYIRTTDIHFNKQFEDIIVPKDTIPDKDRWAKYFTELPSNATDEDWEHKANCYNIAAVVYQMLKDKPEYLNNWGCKNEWEFISKFADDFKNGIFRVENGAEVSGVYKFYFEPTASVQIGSKYYFMTSRDMIAFNAGKKVQNPDFLYAGTFKSLPAAGGAGARSIGSATYLVKEEPIIKMSANTYGMFDKYESLEEFKVGGNYYNSAGVGVITGCTRGEFTPPKVKIVTSIVGLKSYELQGDKIVANLEQAAMSEVRDGYVDEGYGIFNLKDNNVRNQIIAKDGTKYYLNDIYATVKDIIPGKSGGKNGVKAPEVIWEGSMPINRTTNERVEKNYKNIDAYIDNMVLGNVEIAEDVLEKSTFNVFSFIEALRNHSQLFVSTSLMSEGKKVDTAKDSKVKSVVKNGLLNVVNDSSSQKEDDPKEVLDTHTCAIIDEYVPVKDFSKYTNKTGTEGMDPNTATSVINEVKESRGETPVVPQKVGKANLNDVIRIVAQKSKASKDKVLSGEAEIVVYLRYIAIPETKQVNILIHKKNGEEIPNGRKIVSTDILDTSTGTVTLKDIREEGFSDVKPVEYYTHKTFENNDIDKIPLSDGDKTGKGEEVKEPIPNYPIEKTVYVFWEKDEGTPPPPPQVDSGYVVPQWRLSKYWPHLINSDGSNLSGSTSMYFSTHTSCCDCGHCAFLSGSWSYTMVNPNGTFVSRTPNLIDQMKTVLKYIHSKTLDEGSTKSPSLFSPSGKVNLSGNLNAIKITEQSGLKLATWLNSALSDYDIEGSTKPLSKSEGVYKTSDTLDYRFNNLNSFYNGWYSCGCYDTTDDDGNEDHHHQCAYSGQSIGPDSPSYTTQQFGIGITFKRYNQQAKDKFTTSSEVTSENGFTTVKYQLEETLSLYPEYGMLFQADDGSEELKWVVGDENRQINPVVYQTLQHKVYVAPFTSLSSTQNATDSRAYTKAASLGESKKPIIYKGSTLQQQFTIYQNEESKKENSKEPGIMTVKTFALDFEDDGLYGSVKSSWENDWYDSYEQHKNILSAIDTQQKANASEKLLIDSPNYGSIDYTGGTLNAPTNKYEKRNYNHYSNAVGGGDAVVFEHKLIVRGGKLVAIIPQNRSSLAYGSPISIEALKSSDTALYNALVAMNLYDEGGDKNNTIFKNFEHKSGDALTEGSYVNKLNEARKAKDNGFDSSSQAGVSVGEGWYSEDTTVLVVKEYVSNYNVPSIAFSEKVALSVNGLITPQNKAQFFSVMGKGYSYLKYDYPLKSWYTTLSQNVNAYFEYTSFPNDTFAFGEQQVDYLVPNVSILDVTTIS